MFKFNPGNTIHMMTFRTESLILEDFFQNKTLNTYDMFNDNEIAIIKGDGGSLSESKVSLYDTTKVT